MNPDPPQTLAPTTASPPPSKGLRSGSVGLLASVALGLSSVAPAYSIAVTLGFVTVAVGHLAPAALLLGFVPILLTAFAFRELNKEMPDCGTTFVWTTRAFGPASGWLLGGWVTQFATVTAMAALSQVGAGYLLGLLGLDSLASDETAVAVTAALLIGAITVIAYRGLQLAAVVQYVLLALQLVALFGFGAAALARHGALTPSLAWFDPFGFDSFGAFAKAVLLCLYIYWGWDALLTVNEETRDSERTPGKAALISTLVLLVTYLFTAVAAIGFAGTGTSGLGLGNAGERGRRPVRARTARPRHGTREGRPAGRVRVRDLRAAHLRRRQLTGHAVDERPRRAAPGVRPHPPAPPHAVVRHRLHGRGGSGSPRGPDLALARLPRRRDPLHRAAHRALLRRHRPGLRLVVPRAAAPVLARRAPQGSAAAQPAA